MIRWSDDRIPRLRRRGICAGPPSPVDLPQASQILEPERLARANIEKDNQKMYGLVNKAWDEQLVGGGSCSKLPMGWDRDVLEMRAE